MLVKFNWKKVIKIASFSAVYVQTDVAFMYCAIHYHIVMTY